MKRRSPDMAWLEARARENAQHPTPEEVIVWDVLESDWDWDFQKPMILKGARGKYWPLIADFYHDGARLLIELDGRQHEKHKGHDARRDRACEFNGIRTLRFPNRRIHKELEAVLEEINDAVRGRI